VRSLLIALTVAVCLLFGACSRANNELAPVAGPGSQCIPPATKILDTPLKAQETNQWCWAASGQMIMAFHNQDVTQCLQANNFLGRQDCCGSVKPEGCIRGGWPEFNKYNFDFDRSNTHLEWNQLREQIACKSSPVAFSWRWIRGGGHMMVVRGYTTSPNGAKTLYINNPWPPFPNGTGEQRMISYKEYIKGSDHEHWDDFYNIRHR
jgi:Papain-like cysteine protease AvrRpt2